jgi:hypothetical protein
MLVVGISAALSSSLFAQTRRNKPSTNPAPTILSSLPPSDAVAIVKVKKVLDDVLPRLFAGNPEKLARINSEIEQFKTRTAIDPRSFNELALGTRYTYPAPGITKLDTVAIASGTFNAGALAAAGRMASNGKYEEQKYQGKTIYVFKLDQQVKVFGLFDWRIGELAVCPLADNTLVLGNVDGVRKVIDVSKARRRANVELIELAARDPNAVVGFGGNIPQQLIENLRIGNDAIARDLTAVRQVYGSIGATEKDLEVMLAARTVDPSSAKNLSDTIEGLKQFGGLFINRLPASKGALARSALGNLKITTQGNELQIRTAVAQSDIASLVGGD